MSVEVVGGWRGCEGEGGTRKKSARAGPNGTLPIHFLSKCYLIVQQTQATQKKWFNTSYLSNCPNGSTMKPKPSSLVFITADIYKEQCQEIRLHCFPTRGHAFSKFVGGCWLNQAQRFLHPLQWENYGLRGRRTGFAVRTTPTP